MKTSKGNPKQSLAAQYQAEARSLAGSEISAERQFLSVSLDKGKELEPVGSMTSVRRLHFADTK
ncbi:hypothetical protein [Pseudomonas sp. SED1]|uniref:hypothetical protein n=1 Tax=Pseudomonas sp. SED1 TaxID=3056845 RepID=UPI00296ED64B|nr:hypothetical protein [Pseudomonas sp. SED1]MDY0836528.1 hypothetical protein [Pseudomonas sp. SED1]